MGNGFYKLTTSGDCSETKYESVWDINLLSFQRQLENLDQFRGKKILFLTLASGNVRTPEFLEKFRLSKNLLKENQIEVVGLSTNTNLKEGRNFRDQQKFYEDLGIKIFPSVRLLDRP